MKSKSAIYFCKLPSCGLVVAGNHVLAMVITLLSCLSLVPTAGLAVEKRLADFPDDPKVNSRVSRVWQAAGPGQADAGRRQLNLRPGKGHLLTLDATAFKNAVAACPQESTAAARTRPVGLSLPMPD